MKIGKRQWANRPAVWRRNRTAESLTEDDIYYACRLDKNKPKKFPGSIYLDVDTKIAALRAAPSVVSLVSSSGGEEIFQSSGTIIEADGNGGIVLTSASLVECPRRKFVLADKIKIDVCLSDGTLLQGKLVVHDFHFNLAAIKIESTAPLPTAHLVCLEDCISIDPSPKKERFELHPHSNLFKITPGDSVIAVGRFYMKPYDLMAAPGEFSLDCCEGYDCKDLFKAYCSITRCGSGGPLINLQGEVIGIYFHDTFAPFFPTNVVLKWWNHYKTNGELCRPWHGMEVANLYAAHPPIMEKLIQKFPNISKGVIVEKVVPGSPAHSAGICPNDVIVQCGEKAVQSCLQEGCPPFSANSTQRNDILRILNNMIFFIKSSDQLVYVVQQKKFENMLFEVIWDKTGDAVELEVIRTSDESHHNLPMVVAEVAPDKFYSWN